MKGALQMAAANLDAIDPMKEPRTYQGKKCKKCDTRKRYTKSDHCVKCTVSKNLEVAKKATGTKRKFRGNPTH